MIPVVIFHYGAHRFLQTAIDQATSQGNRVILLGDNTNAQFKVEHYFFRDYSKRADTFRPRYIWMTTDPPESNIFNTLRYPMLLEFMERHDLDKVFTCDSDIMLYCNVAEEERDLGNYLAAYDIPKNQSGVRNVAMGNGYWTRQGLIMFCDFLYEAYTQHRWLEKMRYQWEWHVRNRVPGGISEMTTLAFFTSLHKQEIVNISRVLAGNKTFDHAISTPENYEPREYETVQKWGWTIKNIQWIGNNPHCHNLVRGGPVRFCSLHFQGGRKRLMEEYRR